MTDHKAAGGVSPCWILNNSIWLRTDWSVLAIELLRASLLAFVNWGITIAARMPRMITTIRISTRVKPLRLRFINSPHVRLTDASVRRKHYPRDALRVRRKNSKRSRHLPTDWSQFLRVHRHASNNLH